MKNKIIAIFLSFALCAALCGCQLALPGGEEVQRDRLIGCFVTTDDLDLFDHEAYFIDNFDKLADGGDAVFYEDTSAYQGRIYAEYYEETVTGEDGTSHTTGNYRFEALEGISYFAPLIGAGEDWGYTTFQTSEGLHEVKNHVKSFSSGSFDGDVSFKPETYYTELSARVYAKLDKDNEFTGEETMFYMHPVYQSADGSVYLTGADAGFAMNCTFPDTLMTKTLSEESTVSINGEEAKAGGSVSIAFATAYAVERVEILEMSAGAEVLAAAEFSIDELPESYEVQTDTAYILLSAISADGHVERSIVAPGGEHEDIFALVESENGWLENCYCEVLWKEAAR